MKRWLLWILKIFLVMILLSGLLLGFSFLERGDLSQQFARWIGLSIQEKVARHDQVSQVENGIQRSDEPGAEVLGRFITPENGESRIIKQDRRMDDDWIQRERPGNRSYAQPDTVYVQIEDHTWLNLILMWVPFLIGFISLILLAHSFMKKEMDLAQDQAWNAPWRSLWAGFLTILIAMPMMFLLFISIIGFPLAIAVLILFVIATGLGVSAIVRKVGSVVCDSINLSKYRYLSEIILGAVLIAHLIWLPVLGWTLLAGIALLGLGSVMIHWIPRFQEYWREWRQRRAEKK